MLLHIIPYHATSGGGGGVEDGHSARTKVFRTLSKMKGFCRRCHLCPNAAQKMCLHAHKLQQCMDYHMEKIAMAYSNTTSLCAQYGMCVGA